MARTGRPRKPTALKVLHGDAPARIPADEPVPDDQPVEPPASLDAEALAVWHELAPDLERKGLLTHWDVNQFASYCTTVVYARRAEALINQSAVLIHGQNRSDHAVRNPAVVVFRDMTDLQLRIGSRFGLTPSDRASLGKPQGNEPLPGEHLLSR